ncbi:hypothetical protein BDP27DRAFT_1430388 [Rhodocollybia butyracea]|uniref:Uncharacterized protein n=1 Tax=Rhodocollybia butyracea TaxID=206335 RepID=A0A9P5TYV2_9AGAR|nr:hypothetical protein BDP27DRAFT_1430388 [Rhodocollybia butyracea]
MNPTLRIALTGDSRAVLGVKYKVRFKDGDTCSQQTADQNGYKPKEVARLEAEHPGENVVEKERIMGWPGYLGDNVRSNMKTLPYLTAEPEIPPPKSAKETSSSWPRWPLVPN